MALEPGDLPNGQGGYAKADIMTVITMLASYMQEYGYDDPRTDALLGLMKDIVFCYKRPVPHGATIIAPAKLAAVRATFAAGEDGENAFLLSVAINTRLADILDTPARSQFH